MAKFLDKDPVTYERERESFLRSLTHFHDTRGWVDTLLPFFLPKIEKFYWLLIKKQQEEVFFFNL